MDGGGINAGSAPQPHTVTLQLLPNRDQTGFALSQSVRPRVPQMTVALRRQKAPSYPHGPIEAYNCGGTPRLMMSQPIWVRSIVSKRVCSGRARIALVSPMTAGYVVGHDQLGCYVQTKMSSRSRLGRFRNNCPLFPPGDLKRCTARLEHRLPWTPSSLLLALSLIWTTSPHPSALGPSRSLSPHLEYVNLPWRVFDSGSHPAQRPWRSPTR